MSYYKLPQLLFGGSRWANPLCTTFDGSNDYVNFGAGSGLMGAAEYSISMWIELLSYPANYQATYWGDSGGYFALICASAGTGQIQFLNFGGGTSVVQTLALNTKTHLVLTKKTGSATKLYKDASTSGGTNSVDTNASGLANNFYLGGLNLAGYQVNMKVQLMEVWNLYLTGANVTELYNGGVAKDPSTVSFAANLTHNYRMGNGDTHPTITDRTGIKNGTMNNMSSANFITW